MSKKIEWKSAPEAKDYEGVRNFLTLFCTEPDVDALIERLKKATPIERAGKDLLRAAALPLLSEDDPHVSEDLKVIRKDKSLARSYSSAET